MSDTVIPASGPTRAASPVRTVPPNRIGRPSRAERRRRKRARARAIRTGTPVAPVAPNPRDLLSGPAVQVAQNIARQGVHLVHVGESCSCPGCTADPEPVSARFGYTVGLTEVGHPELLVRGLDARETAEVLSGWSRAVRDGTQLAVGHLLCEGPGGHRWEVLPANGRELIWACEYYGRPAHDPGPALELVRTDLPCPCERPH